MQEIQEEILNDISQQINSNIDLQGLNEKQESILIQSIFISISLLFSVMLAMFLK